MKRQIAELALIAIGTFLAVDGFILHGLSFDYSVLNIEFLDPFISHGLLGIIFITIALIDIKVSK